MAGRLLNKVAIVTGGTSGIGRATAKLFAKEGAKVVFAGRREKNGMEIEKEIRAEGGEATFIQCDVTLTRDLENLVNNTVGKYGTIDVLFNNAGICLYYKSHEMDVERDYDAIFDVNCKSYFILTKLVLPYMQKQKSGSIVNMSSIAAIQGVYNQASYRASKAAIIQFTQSIALDYAGEGIRANCLSPGFTVSEMFDEVANADLAKNQIPMGRAATAEEIAYAVLFFAGDECKFCTGANLLIDGATSCRLVEVNLG